MKSLAKVLSNGGLGGELPWSNLIATWHGDNVGPKGFHFVLLQGCLLLFWS